MTPPIDSQQHTHRVDRHRRTMRVPRTGELSERECLLWPRVVQAVFRQRTSCEVPVAARSGTTRGVSPGGASGRSGASFSSRALSRQINQKAGARTLPAVVPWSTRAHRALSLSPQLSSTPPSTHADGTVSQLEQVHSTALHCCVGINYHCSLVGRSTPLQQSASLLSFSLSSVAAL